MAPVESLARLRKRVLDRVARGEVTVTRTCREAGISRARYYQFRRRYLAYGETGLRPRPHPARPTRQFAPPLVDAIVSYAVAHPTESERSIAATLRLARFGAWRVSHGGQRAAPRGSRAPSGATGRGGGARRGRGWPTHRAHPARDPRDRAARIMHLGSATVGSELFADSMYVGKLKNVGTIWQLSMVDGACSFGFAGVHACRKIARRMAEFLERHMVPAYREADIRIVRINTDRGPEFGKVFTRKCVELGIEHHRLPPRSPDLNAFVERFQGSCLHLHYRTAFRYRYYRCAGDIDADLQAWLRHSNFERPHRGYRTAGGTPASIFYAHRPHLLKVKGWDPNELRIRSRAVSQERGPHGST